MDKSIDFREFSRIYLESISSTIKSHYQRTIVLGHYCDFFNGLSLGEIRRAQVHNYIQQRLAAGLSHNSINVEIAILSAAINYVKDRYEIDDYTNPCLRQRLRTTGARLRYLEHEEAANLVSQAEAINVDLSHFIRLALHTGCRKGELLSLAWSDVDLKRRFLVIRPDNTKTARRRILPLNVTALETFQTMREQSDGLHVFNKKHGPADARTFDYLFKKAREAAEIEDFRIHDLRHTFASWLVMSGVELIKVRDLLGHTSVKMTERYAHLAPDRLQAAVSVLDGLF